MAEENIFSKLSAVDVNEHLDKKESGKDKYGRTITLSYLSWAWAWDYFKKICPNAKYEIRHWNDRPYMYDENLGYMVETSITANNETHTMWLPVMDSSNSAMKATQQVFAIKRKDGTTYNKIVAPATMFDINKTIMRCLVKNMAMFGLGLYIYAGEDLPTDNDTYEQPKTTIEQQVGDSIPFATPAPQTREWANAEIFAQMLEFCDTVDAVQDCLNQQRNNPNLQTLIPLATAKKHQIEQRRQ